MKNPSYLICKLSAIVEQFAELVSSGVSIDFDQIREQTERLNSLAPHKATIEETITEIVCDYFKMSKEEISVRTRKDEVKFPRQCLHYFLGRYTKLTLDAIASITGGHNHATILHSKRTIANLRESCPEIRKRIQFIENRILFALGKSNVEPIENPEPIVKLPRPQKKEMLDTSLSIRIQPKPPQESKFLRYAVL